ncbi:hypothetical protein ATO6_15840 [Oceanicola sp. 22II-s10i]|uniref:rhodanese-like domain-containing protein n=1 Tax=Oceanicola sp. 22II-s10i TaxID=1317116 RepID=UPI000B528180|nr:rhodanese-like domain-containing protein [Oceanicola sp. 22II-s10i]OWU83888.1 hypothetical protein ATO6_15840 [Oceanicola sp. 22II-s10i]
MFQFLNRTPSAPALSAADAIAAGDEVILVDIRELGEVRASGMARGAIHIPLMMLQFRADPRHPDYDARLKPDARICLYCASGGRAGSALGIMRQLGYSDVHNIGGLAHWARAGGEVVKA